ncbi:MAG: hypothetical protein P1P77_09370 [Spirochaetaceae bacterium]|nr:hypothetical protein [Spirochaetaceae bacterium]
MESGAGSVSPSGLYTAPAATGTDKVRVTDAVERSRVATILVQDDAGLTADASVVIVRIGPPSISPPSVTVEQNSVFDFSTSGGTPRYRYTIFSGSGSVNSSTGEYMAPSALGNETVRVTDASLKTSDATVSVAPAAPTFLAVDGSNGDPQKIDLTWTDNVVGEDGFSIECKFSGGSFNTIVNVGLDVTVYEDGGLAPNDPVSSRVRSYSGTVYSSYSNDDFAIPNS